MEKNVKTEIELTTLSDSGRLTILYDPRNFDDEVAAPIITEIGRLVTTEAGATISKSRITHRRHLDAGGFRRWANRIWLFQ